MSKNSNKKFRWAIPFAVLSATCASVGIMAGCDSCNSDKGEHTHTYEWKYDENGTEHWKECPADGVEEEGSRGQHVFIAGECECGATQVAVNKKYAKAEGTIKLNKLGANETDFSDVTLDMGDEVEPELDTSTGNFTVENVEVGKKYTLVVSKPGYQSYSVTVQADVENETVKIGGNRGIVLEYTVFNSLVGWDADLHDLSHVNDAEPYIEFKANDGGKSLNVITADSYNNVAATYNVKYNNSTHGFHLQGLAFKFEDGKHLVIRFHTHSIQIAKEQWGSSNVLPEKDTLFGADVTDTEYGENWLYRLTDEEMEAIKGNEGLELTAVLKDGKLYIMFNGLFLYSYELPEGYATKKAQIAYYAYDAASNAKFNYKITEELPELETQFDFNVTNPTDGTECSVSAEPQKDAYNFLEEVELTFNAPEGYKLDALYINGEDKYNSVENGKITLLADHATIQVNATFVKEEPVAFSITVKGKKLGATTNLSAGTVVTLSGAEYPVNADGKITGAIVKGRYVVSVDGYHSKEISIDEELEEVTLEYDLFYVVRWDTEDHDFTHVNEEEPSLIFKGLGSSLNAVSKGLQLDEAVVSVVLKGSYTTDGANQQGLILKFDDGKAAILNINTDGTPRLQYRPELFSENYDLTIGLRTAFESEWVEFRNVTAEEVAKYNSDAGIELKVYRRGTKLYTYLDGVLKGIAELPETYDDSKMEFGVWSYGAVNGSAWKFNVSDKAADFPALTVTITNGTEANAGGTVSISPEVVNIGDTVTITVTPDATHILQNIVLSDGTQLEVQDDGTYKFVATKTEYTVTATFADKPTVEAETTVSGIGLGNTPITFENGTAVIFTPEQGAATTLTVTDGKVKGVLLPGKYTAAVEGYYGVEVVVGDDSLFEDLTDGIKFEKIIFVHDGIGEPQDNLNAAGFLGVVADSTAAASTGVITSEKQGSIYEWTVDEYKDVAISFTFQRKAKEQGIMMLVAHQKVISVRFQDNNNNPKMQWLGDWFGGWFWGTQSAISAFDFGESYLDPLSSDLLTKYESEEGLKVTLLRKGSMLYVLVDGKLCTAHILGQYANSNVKFGLYVQDTEKAYNIPFEIDTDVDAILNGLSTDDILGVSNVSNLTVGNGNITVDGRGYAEVAPTSTATTEYLAINIASDKANKQGLTYRFADGKWFGFRYEPDYIQYTEDLIISGNANGRLKGWQTIHNFTDEEKASFANSEQGLELALLRNGKYVYVMLGGNIIDTIILGDEYATMDGVAAINVEGGKNVAFAYEYKSGDEVAIPDVYTVTTNVKDGAYHGYDISVDKTLVKNGESVTLTIKTGSDWGSAWSWFPVSVKVNGVEKFVSSDMVSNGANHLTYTLTIDNVSEHTVIDVEIGKGETIANGVVVTVKDGIGGTAVSDSGENGYYWNDGCDIDMSPDEGYEIESITVDDGTPVTEGWTENNGHYVYTLPVSVTKPISVVVTYKAVETAPEPDTDTE